MENQDKEIILKLKYYSIESFAKADQLLRSGVHLQDYKGQSKYFRFIEENIDELCSFYEKAYQAKLSYHPSINGKFYYLDYFDERRSKLAKESLKDKYTLFAIFLYTIHRLEKRFSTILSKQELLEVLNNHPKIKPHIHNLFFKGIKEETKTTRLTLEKWINDSLRELEKLGWIQFLEEDNDQFELLPAFERIALIYSEAINSIDEIRTSND